eukprot:gene6394-7049_t
MTDEEVLPFDEFEETALLNILSNESSLMYRAVAVIPTAHHDLHFFDTHRTINKTMETIPSTTIKLNSKSISSKCEQCPLRPTLLSNTFFSAHISDFQDLKLKIESTLAQCSEFDSSYVSKECMWKCKYLRASFLCELDLSVYWDPQSLDHIVEVKCIRGESFRPSVQAFFEALQRAILGQCPGPVCKPRRGCLSRGASPIPSMDDCNLYIPSEEDFLAGIEPIHKMVGAAFLESRLEAVKMLCDLSTKQPQYLEHPVCVNLCIESLCKLLTDDFEDVRQLSLNALCAFLELPVYRQAFVTTHLAALEYIASLIANCPPNELSCGCAAMRRSAAAILNHITRIQPQSVLQILQALGYSTEEEWLQHVGKLRDERTRQIASEVNVVYLPSLSTTA